MEAERPAVIAACGAFVVAAGTLAATASFWADEGDTWATSATSTSYFLDALREWDSHAPLYFAIVRAVAVLGDQELVLRLPSIVAGVVAVVLVGRLSEVLAGSRARPVGVLLGATNALLLYHSSEARSYALTMALGAAATLALVRASREPSRGAWARYGIATSLLVLSHTLAVTLVAAHGLWSVLEWRRTGRRPSAAAWAAWGVIAAACAVAAGFLLTANGSETEFEALTLRSPVVLVREVFGGRSWLPLLPASLAFALGARSALTDGGHDGATAATGGDRPPAVRLLVLVTATLPIALLLLASAVSPSSLAGGRYASPVVPAAIAVVAAGVTGLAGGRGRALLCLTALAGVAAQVQVASGREFEDVESAMALVRRAPGEPAAVAYFDPYVAWVGAYYLRDVDADERPRLLVPDGGYPAPLRVDEPLITPPELAAAAADGPPLLWLVVRPRDAEARADDYGAMRATLDEAGYEATATRRFSGVEVVELRRAP